MHRVIGIDPGSRIAGIAVMFGRELKSVRRVESLKGKPYDDNDLAGYLTAFMLEIQNDIEIYEPNLLVCELTSVRNNMHTNKLLSYWEAAALIAGSMNNIQVKRFRTSEGRKIALGKSCKKDIAIEQIKKMYSIANYDYGPDEAEAILFALAGNKWLETQNLMNIVLP